ncbi:MAG: phosphomannomutase/phosphoglucomutase [Bacteroidales bacterium]|nr:phosphomannomutase/phosphoglucomutase [Bacteroidales bacterium]
MGAFHAYDIRGIYNVDFDSYLAYKVGYFIPVLLEADKVLVGRDARLSSPEIFEYVAKGINDAGADVYDLGLSTTPMVYFGTARHGFRASVQITASHNPKEYNGMKVSRENALPVGFDTGLSTIQQWIEEGRETPVVENRGKIIPFDISQEYISFLKSWKEDISDLKISIDISNGMASLFVRKIFGDDAIYIFEELDGTFPNHDPNPLAPENRIELQKSVITNRNDVGVIFDGDADRVMFVDERGNFISPDLIIALLGHYFLENKNYEGARPLVLQDIRSSKSVAEYLEPMGAEVVTWKVGRAFAAHKLREIDGLFGGELAGHYYFKDFFYSDSGILAAILALNVIARFKRKGVVLSHLIEKISSYFSSGEINFAISKKEDAMVAVREFFVSQERPTASYDFDGYRVEFPQWWFNIRPSNTEPYLRFICEATSIDLLEEKVAQAREVIKSFS